MANMENQQKSRQYLQTMDSKFLTSAMGHQNFVNCSRIEYLSAQNNFFFFFAILRELKTAGTPDAEDRKQVNGKYGKSTEITAVFTNNGF
jgi:hypothetical protein